jgi:hypothetical protein
MCVCVCVSVCVSNSHLYMDITSLSVFVQVDVASEAKKVGGPKNLLTELNNLYGKYKFMEG